ncbi:hypothetical protein IU485_28350 [Nocardia cyriacigeorgica]|uniref:hypothetical protein n=1 Tax=Nocardia cyriacigeorgica TaxID=135487 RepID=UPI0018959442|nr:hypothetical protein [Nocardia cyriacigeorgica]MBF6085285.1 hypothetical protein [Nocardia cyriacigeorgica]
MPGTAAEQAAQRLTPARRPGVARPGQLRPADRIGAAARVIRANLTPGRPPEFAGPPPVPELPARPAGLDALLDRLADRIDADEAD